MSTETEEKSETDLDTKPGKSHIFCGHCYRNLQNIPGVREAFCGVQAPSEGRLRFSSEPGECEECVRVVDVYQRQGCPKCYPSR
jgi:hypothetical protein